MRALVTAGLIVLATLSPAAVPQGNASRPAHHHPDHGCALYLSVPNPCDPDSAD